MKKEKKS